MFSLWKMIKHSNQNKKASYDFIYTERRMLIPFLLSIGSVATAGHTKEAESDRIERSNGTMVSVLSSIADLYDFPVSNLIDGKEISLSGYQRPGDGGGGRFFWRIAANDPSDGALIIKPNGLAGPGRWVRVSDGSLSVKAFGAIGDGVADDTAALSAAFSAGGVITVPNGNYRIANKGPKSGGVKAIVTNGVEVICSPRARIFGDGLDNPLIQLVRVTSAASPDIKPTVIFRGGMIDTSLCKLSTSHPFRETSVKFAADQGRSDVTDGIYLHGSYQPVGSTRRVNAWALISIEDVRFYGGKHWQASGGDSGVFCDGADIISVQRCHFIGINDSGVYVSQSTDGTTNGRIAVRDCYYLNCCHGVSVKRGPSGFDISHNTFIGCARAITVEHLIGNSPRSGSITWNRTDGCGSGVRLYNALYVDITGNCFESMGAYLSDGKTIVPDHVSGVNLFGCRNCSIRGNHGIGVGRRDDDSNAVFIRLERYLYNGKEQLNTMNVIEDNSCEGWPTFTNESQMGSKNTYRRNDTFDVGAVSGRPTTVPIVLPSSSP